MLWGTYRPGLYFGLRPRAPKSLIFGLMWMDPTRRDALSNIRHQAEERDGLAQYGWLAHDGEVFGHQRIFDESYNISTSWVKHWNPDDDGDGTGGVIGGAWSARIEGQERKKGIDDENEEADQPQVAISFFIYVATEDGSPIKMYEDDVIKAIQSGQDFGQGTDSGIVKAMSGKNAPFGPWSLHIHRHSLIEILQLWR